MGQYKDFEGDTGHGPLLMTALYTYTFLLRHHSLELPVYIMFVLLLLFIDFLVARRGC